MNIWNAFPFVRYSLALIVGIVLNAKIPELWDRAYFTTAVLIIPVFFTAFFFRKRKLELFRVLSGFSTLLLITFLGGYLAVLNDDRNRGDHYQNLHDEVIAFSGKVVSDHYERENYFRYELALDQILTESGQKVVGGKMYLYVKKDSLPVIFPYGTQFYVEGTFFEIDTPKNPDEFNYRQYLAHKNIFAHAFVSHEDLEVVGYNPANPVLGFAFKVRTSSSKMIADFIPGDQEAAVINALLIGVKDFLDAEIKEAYSAAGAMHVLAVSGLHVGIVYLLITLVFGQLKTTSWGKVFFVVISLTVIWCYALITGFSPSVMRAATMFSVIILAESSGRKTNIYNSLGLAAFILLLYNPYFVFEVGFQLSFIAVLGIVMFQPPIYQLWNTPNKFFDYLWAIISVSIAAQLVTFPLSIYYFHQFPTYFLFSNMIVIPSSMVMLSTGLFMLGVGSFSAIAGETIGFLLGGFVEWINWLILRIQVLPFPVVDWLYLGGVSVLLLYLFMLYFFHAVRNYHFHALIFSLCCLFLIFANFSFEEYQRNHQKRIIVYHSRDALAIDLISGKETHLLTFGNTESLPEVASFSIDPHRLVSGLHQVTADLDNSQETDIITRDGIHFTVWKGLRILVVDDDTKGSISQPIDADITVLQVLDQELISKIQSKFLVIGPISNWRERTALINYLNEGNFNYFDTNEQGAFVLDLRDYPKSD